MPQEEVLKRVMPHSLEAEQSVIGSMLLDPDAIEVASEMLREEDFYSRQNGVLFETITEMYQKDLDVDPVTLQTRLRDKNLPPEVYSTELIRDLIAQVPTSANIRSYAELVASKSILRRMIRANEEIAAACYGESEEVETILDQAEKKVFEISQRRAVDSYVPIRQVVLNAMERIEKASRIKGNVTGLSTGFTDLDVKTAGLQNSDLILIAARPSMGKTALTLNIAEYLTMRENRCVAIFSLEMSKEQLMNRLLSMDSHVDAQKIRTGDLSDQEWGDIIESAGMIGESRLILDDTPAITVSEMRTRCRKYKMEFGLKSLARELQVPIIALSQLSRAVEGRPNKRPMLSDLRESGAIEQDADVVMFIYRDEYYNPDSEKKGVAEIIIAKQRNGPIGTVELGWQPQLTRFTNLAR